MTARNQHSDLHANWCHLLGLKLESWNRSGGSQTRGLLVTRQVHRNASGPEARQCSRPDSTWNWAKCSYNEAQSGTTSDDQNQGAGSDGRKDSQRSFSQVTAGCNNPAPWQSQSRHIHQRQPDCSGLEGHGAMVKALALGEVDVSFPCLSSGGTN